MPTLGKQMIDMYVAMITEEFAPLIKTLHERTEGLEDAVRIEVKKDLGIYNLYLDIEKHKMAIKEIEQRLKKYEKEKKFIQDDEGNFDYNRSMNGFSLSRIELEVRARLQKLNAPLMIVKQQKADIIKRIKLTGVSKDVAEIFEGIGTQMDKLVHDYSNLPAITSQTLKQIKGKVKGKPRR